MRYRLTKRVIWLADQHPAITDFDSIHATTTRSPSGFCRCHLVRKCGSALRQLDLAVSTSYLSVLCCRNWWMRTGDSAPRLRLHYIRDSHNFNSRQRQAPIPIFWTWTSCGNNIWHAVDLYLGLQHERWLPDLLSFSATSQSSAEKC